MNLILFFLGLFLTGAGILSLRKNQKLVKTGIKTMAKIVEVQEKRETDSEGYNKKMYYPVLEFIDTKQQSYNFVGNVGVSNKRKYKIGNEIEVIYDPQKPEKASVKTFGILWLMPIALTLVGLMLIIGSFSADFS